MNNISSTRVLDVNDVDRELDELASFLRNDFRRIILTETDSLQDGISMLGEKIRTEEKEINGSEEEMAA
jgi:hypothetical protein